MAVVRITRVACALEQQFRAGTLFKSRIFLHTNKCTQVELPTRTVWRAETVQTTCFVPPDIYQYLLWALPDSCSREVLGECRGLILRPIWSK